jgi:flagellar biosynthesis chaperone FliJ
MNQHDLIKQLKEKSSEGIKTVRYDAYIFAILMFLSVLGVAIADASERMSHWY